jgi:hypothetical protein
MDGNHDGSPQGYHVLQAAYAPPYLFRRKRHEMGGFSRPIFNHGRIIRRLSVKHIDGISAAT